MWFTWRETMPVPMRRTVDKANWKTTRALWNVAERPPARHCPPSPAEGRRRVRPLPDEFLDLVAQAGLELGRLAVLEGRVSAELLPP
jgi:hypothetical protein